ncbi:MAG TPA: hypothetical protein VGI45_22600 [Terracidiphilus sp.]|jgi:hypothetical protein
METNSLEKPVHLTGAKAEGFCKELKNAPDAHPAETSYPHLVTCRSCIEYMKERLGSGRGSQGESSK